MTAICNAAQAESILVEVRGIDTSRGGSVLAMLFGADGFPKDHSKAISIQSRPANKGQMTFEFQIELSEFAIKVLHDEDDSGQGGKGSGVNRHHVRSLARCAS